MRAPPPSPSQSSQSKKLREQESPQSQMAVTLPPEDEEAAEAAAAEEEEDDDEEVLVALIEHRTREVNHLRHRVTYYTSQLKEAEKRLRNTERRLGRLRSPGDKEAVRKAPSELEEDGSGAAKRIKLEPSVDHRPPSKPKLVIPSSENHKVSSQESQPPVSASNARRASPQSKAIVKSEKSSGQSSSRAAVRATPEKSTKRKSEQEEHLELIPLIRSSSSPTTFRCHSSCQISSQHKRKLRSLSLCPANDTLFATSALDGVVNLWEIQSKGSGASLLTGSDCFSPSQRRWPEDMAWHPEGNSIFCAYSADGGDAQVSIVNLNKSQGKGRVTFLEDRPHVKGIINSIAFLPREDHCFVTGGSDHAVILWNPREQENSWKPKALHKSLHSSAVMGVAGMRQKDVVLSAGADKRILGFDVQAGRPIFSHQIENKCMSVLPNPCDFNLFMVQTGSAKSQLRLYDIRLRQTELHAFGWKQESSESQSALVNQAWSPDGLCITSGSADPIIHIFDIRYSARKPSQSVKAHQKRVFKAVWHRSLPLLISISSDLGIGLHKIT